MASKLPLKSAYPFGIRNGLTTQIEKIRDLDIRWHLAYTSTLRRGYIIDLFMKEGLFQKFKDQDWPDGNTPQGEKQIKFYLKVKSRYEEFLAGGTNGELPVDGEVPDETDEEEEHSFGAEADLQNFLSKNMGVIEPGLILYQKDGTNGIEYSIDGGRIDILAIDKTGRYVVIELKLTEAKSRAMGQLLYYMGWVDQHLGNGPCRGIVIARDIGDDLLYASKRVSGISLMRYHLSVSLEKVPDTSP